MVEGASVETFLQGLLVVVGKAHHLLSAVDDVPKTHEVVELFVLFG